jgi:dolichol-phosphate mannosyltransferase
MHRRSELVVPFGSSLWAAQRKVTVIVPCFNERDTILEILDRVKAVPLDKHIVVIDNASTDGTRELLQSICANERDLATADDIAERIPGQRCMDGDGFTLVLQPRNLHKGTSVRLGLALAQSDYVICQDADLEYDPRDIARLLEHAERTGADAVFGSRLRERSGRRLNAYQIGRIGFVKAFHALYGGAITDVATCYKLMRTETARSLGLRASGFDLDFEIPARLRKGNHTIEELAVSYTPRDRAHGKKIRWHDGLLAAWTLLKLRWL